MKKQILIFVTLFFLLNINAQQITDDWKFPVRPGTQEWENLKTYTDRLNAYNIPEIQIMTMSTEGLAKTCLNYPEFRLIFTRNDLQSGYKYIETIFNGFQEVKIRKDAGRKLLDIYKEMDAAKFDKNWKNLDKGKFMVKFTYIELMLAQSEILNNMNAADKKDLISEATKKFESKNRFSEEYGIIGLKTSVLILARILELDGNLSRNETVMSDNAVNAFLYFALVENPSILYEIVNKSKNTLKNENQ